MRASKNCSPSSHPPSKILIAPHEIAGQMAILARSLKALGASATSAQYVFDGTSPGECDISIHLSGGRGARTAKKAAFAYSAVRKYEIFHFFFGESLLPQQVDLQVLRHLGKRVVVHFRGSDITSRQLRRTSYESGDPNFGPRWTEPLRQRLERWRRAEATLLISTPDLWVEVPDALWLPQAIELSDWPFRQRRPMRAIVVGHAPSNRLNKGTDAVLNAVSKLKQKGYAITLDLVERVPQREVPQRMKHWDICVDQLSSGAYGNVTIQAMATGVPTVNNTLTAAFESLPWEVPTVQTTSANLETALEALILDSSRRKDLGFAGRAYVETIHDSRRVAERALLIYAGDDRPLPPWDGR